MVGFFAVLVFRLRAGLLDLIDRGCAERGNLPTFPSERAGQAQLGRTPSPNAVLSQRFALPLVSALAKCGSEEQIGEGESKICFWLGDSNSVAEDGVVPGLLSKQGFDTAST